MISTAHGLPGAGSLQRERNCWLGLWPSEILEPGGRHGFFAWPGWRAGCHGTSEGLCEYHRAVPNEVGYAMAMPWLWLIPLHLDDHPSDAHEFLRFHELCGCFVAACHQIWCHLGQVSENSLDSWSVKALEQTWSRQLWWGMMCKAPKSQWHLQQKWFIHSVQLIACTKDEQVRVGSCWSLLLLGNKGLSTHEFWNSSLCGSIETVSTIFNQGW